MGLDPGQRTPHCPCPIYLAPPIRTAVVRRTVLVVWGSDNLGGRMTSFTDRERAAEAKFVHDQDVRFEDRMRQVRRVADWAALRLGLSDPDERASYAAEIVKAEVNQAEAGLSKVRHHLAEAGMLVSDEEISQAIQG